MPKPGAGESLQELASELERIANDVQAMARELHPPALAGLGLLDALASECANFSRRTGLAVAYRTGMESVDVDEQVAIAILGGLLGHASADTAAECAVDRDAGAV